MNRVAVFFRAGMLGLVLASSSAHATSNDPSPIAVRVGNLSMTAAEVSRRLAVLPAFQQLTLGRSAAEIRRAFVERVIVPELLYAQEAEARKLRESAGLRPVLREVLVRALESELRSEVERALTDADVQAFFAKNGQLFATPARIRLWRIAVSDEGLAKRIIEQARGTAGVKNWHQLARDHSLDKATYLRDGDLGFVRQDGTTDVPSVRVDPALFAAADKAADGELVPTPLREGQFWAVVWRRGSMPAKVHSLAEERATIRQLLVRERFEQRVQALTRELTREHASAPAYELVDGLEVPAFAKPTERANPAAPGSAPKARYTPVATERGLR